MKGNKLVIVSYDDALHPYRKKDESSIVSFLPLLIAYQILNTPGLTARNSKHIFMWMKNVCNEKHKKIFQGIICIYNDKMTMRINEDTDIDYIFLFIE